MTEGDANVLPEPPEQPITYAVRFSVQANRDAIDAAVRLAEITGDEEVGRQWYAGLREAAGALASGPRGFPVAERESRLFGTEVRRRLYRRTPGSVTYHAYYTVMDASDDGPLVMVIHVRHAARKPVTHEEARRIIANQ